MDTPKFRSKRSWLLRAGMLLPGLLAGCYGGSALHVDNCSTIPPGAIPAPNGTYMNKVRDAQAAKAEADDFVIYKNMWFKDTAELGPYGRYQMNEIVRRLPGVPFPVVIQPVLDNDELNHARLKTVLAYLQRAGIPDPEARVVLAFPQAEGLFGDEAERIYGQLIGGGGRGGGRGGDFSPFGGYIGGGIGGFGTFGAFGGGFGGGRGGR